MFFEICISLIKMLNDLNVRFFIEVQVPVNVFLCHCQVKFLLFHVLV